MNPFTLWTRPYSLVSHYVPQGVLPDYATDLRVTSLNFSNNRATFRRNPVSIRRVGGHETFTLGISEFIHSNWMRMNFETNFSI